MIDIKSSPANQGSAGTSSNSLTSIILAIALAFVVYDTGYWKKFVPDREEERSNELVSAQILFVTDESMSAGQGQASISQKIDRFCDENGIEKRRLEGGQDISGAEPWLKDMAEIGYGQAPSIVFRDKSGRLDCIPIPNGIDETIDAIKERM